MKHPLVRVLAGFAVAALLASVAVPLRYLRADPRDVMASSGMYAFGDLLTWVGVFALAGALPLWWLLGWLRTQGSRWDVPSLAVLVFSLTAPFAVLCRYTPLGRGSHLDMFAVLFQLAAPVFALAIALAWAHAPTPRSRARLLWAGLMQAACAVSLPIQFALQAR